MSTSPPLSPQTSKQIAYLSLQDFTLFFGPDKHLLKKNPCLRQHPYNFCHVICLHFVHIDVFKRCPTRTCTEHLKFRVFAQKFSNVPSTTSKDLRNVMKSWRQMCSEPADSCVCACVCHADWATQGCYPGPTFRRALPPTLC